MFNITTKTFQYGDQTVTLETGKIARQANGAVTVTMGNSKVLATVVGRREASATADFFPLTVNYQEKTYAAGRIPGGFFKREGRPTEKETLTSRLIDRPIRPLFPKGYRNEVQVILTVISADKDHDPDIPAMIGASAALAISGIPFAGPIAAARVGLDPNAGYILNPSLRAVAGIGPRHGGGGHPRRRTDGRIGSQRVDRRPDARRSALRPAGNAGRH